MMVATLLEDSLPHLTRALHDHDGEADAFEVRLDALAEDADLAEVRKLTPKPLIATYRRPADGGRRPAPEDHRIARLQAALDAGFDFVDLEANTPLKAPRGRVLRSHHDFHTTPDTDSLVATARGLASDADHAKVATKVTQFQDTLHLLAAQHRLHRDGVRASLMGLGDFPRPLAHLLGAEFVYGGARVSAPGQPGLRETVQRLQRWGRPAPARELYLVVGHPVHHTLSPRIHNAAFAQQGRDAAYGALDVETHDQLHLLLERAADLDLAGLSVTAPLKHDAYELAARHTPEALRARAANCLRVRDGAIEGHNTDGLGAHQVIQSLVRRGTTRPRVLLIGTGGAARGLLSSVKGVEFVVAGRNEKKLRAIEAEFTVGAIPLNQAVHYLDSYDVLVNATTVHDPLPQLDAYRGALFDLHYGDEPTTWEQHARDHANRFAGGRDLLLEQAIPSYEYWTGTAAPRDAMTKALEATP